MIIFKDDNRGIVIVEKNKDIARELWRFLKKAGMRDISLINLRVALNNYNPQIEYLMREGDAKILKIFYGVPENVFKKMTEAFQSLAQENMAYIGKFSCVENIVFGYQAYRLSHPIK